MLSAQHLVKSFAGRRVIEEVTLKLDRGEVSSPQVYETKVLNRPGPLLARKGKEKAI